MGDDSDLYTNPPDSPRDDVLDSGSQMKWPRQIGVSFCGSLNSPSLATGWIEWVMPNQ